VTLGFRLLLAFRTSPFSSPPYFRARTGGPLGPRPDVLSVARTAPTRRCPIVFSFGELPFTIGPYCSRAPSRRCCRVGNESPVPGPDFRVSQVPQASVSSGSFPNLTPASYDVLRAGKQRRSRLRKPGLSCGGLSFALSLYFNGLTGLLFPCLRGAAKDQADVSPTPPLSMGNVRLPFSFSSSTAGLSLLSASHRFSETHPVFDEVGSAAILCWVRLVPLPCTGPFSSPVLSVATKRFSRTWHRSQRPP